MRIIGNDPNKPRQTAATASGTLPNGKPVVVNADGTVSVVSGVIEEAGSPVLFQSSSIEEVASAYDANAQKVVVFYPNIGNSNYGTAIVGTVSGTSISFGSPVVFESSYTGTYAAVYDTNAQKVVICYNDNQNHVARVGTVSGTSISFGSKTTFQGGSAIGLAAAYDSTNNKIVLAYGDSQNSTYGTGIVGTVSGTSISFGSETVFNNGGYTSYIGMAYDTNAQKVALFYMDGANDYTFASVGTVSGTSISFGTRVSVFNGRSEQTQGMVYDTSAQKVVVAYRDGSNSNYGVARVGTISGTSISFGSPVVFNPASTEVPCAAYNTDTNKVVVAYKDQGNSNYGTIAIGTVSGTSISFDPEVVVATANTAKMAVLYDPDSQTSVVSYKDGSNSNYGTSVVFRAGNTNLTAENYIGMSGGGVDVTSQAESIGSPVVYNNAGNTTKPHLCFDTSNNKVVIGFVDNALTEKGSAIVGTVSGTSISFGTKTVYEQSVTDFPAMVYDSDSNKVIVAYQDEGNSDYGTVAVGTVSGTSISFGTPVVFESAAVQHVSLAFDSNSNKVVISYSDHGNSEYGTAIVGTVSGTTMSFGSAVVFESAQTARVSSTFDSSNNKVVVAYRTSTGKSAVGTVSGTSISFGTPVEFYNALTDELDIVFDSNVNKVVIAYQSSASDAGLAKVGTVSGTSISFGTEATFESANVASISPVFDSSINKVVLVYSDVGNSRYGTYAVGTISGTDITFGTPSVFASVDTRSFVGAVFDTTSSKIVTAYRDDSNSSYGTSVVMVPGYTDITRGEVADGGNAVVDVQGGISDTQIGLTAAESYYVLGDGTISTTAGDPSVFAGTAVSATKLIVKG